MKVFKDDSYGADIDGNRGTTVYEYELEKSDRDYIVECIMEQYEPDETRYTVTFDNPYTGEDIDIEVDIYEWLSDDEIKEHRRKEYLEALRVAYRAYREYLIEIEEDSSLHRIRGELQ